MAVGYEVKETERSYEQQGITGTVTRGAIENCKYPCMILYSTEESQLPKYKLNVLQSMLKASTVIQKTEQSADEVVEDNRNIYLYLTNTVKTVRLGSINPKQVKSIINLFQDCKLEAYLNKDKKLEGQYIYVLSD